MSEELKPCPFCGEQAVIYEHEYRACGKNRTLWHIGCSRQDCTVTLVGNVKCRTAAIRSWNRRSSPWISVEDRLPDDGQTVAFVVGDCSGIDKGRVLGGRYSAGYSGFSIPGNSGIRVTHWMPLPEPPTEATDEER